MWVGDERYVFTAEGNGPGQRDRHRPAAGAVQQAYPQLAGIHLTDYKVRILDGGEATGAVTRVLLSATDGERDWTTIGVSPNIIEASWRALEESVVYGLLHSHGPSGLVGSSGYDSAPHGCPQVSPRRTREGTNHYSSPDVVPGRLDAGSAGHGRRSAAGRPAPRRPRARPGLRTDAGHPARRQAATAGPGARGRCQPGCVGIALRRASLFSRAPIIHDLTLAFTIWGFFDPDPPGDLLGVRRRLFEGVGNVTHHYSEGRVIADLVPESTLRMTAHQAAAAYPAKWASLTGAEASR